MDIIGLVGSLASIIGHPIAIWQIHTAKGKIQAAENAITKLTEINKFQKYQGIIRTLEDVLNSVSTLISSWNKQGIKKDDQAKKVQEVIRTIHHCIVEMPDGTDTKVINAFKSATGFFEDAIREEKIESVRSARGQLHTAISKLKEIAEQITDEEGKVIARGSQEG